MRRHSLRSGLSLAVVVLGIEAASAFAGRPVASGSFGPALNATPVAMCGRTCQNGGRYIPGPPEVCSAEGLEYCGSSRGGGYGGGYGGGPDRGPQRERGYAFDEGEYLRCNPDVRRAIRNGEMESAMAHYQRHGRREGRRLSC